MLVPLQGGVTLVFRLQQQVLQQLGVSPFVAVSAWPGARTSGLMVPSYQVGPRELNGETSSSSRAPVPFVRSEPTVNADGALPGELMPA